jgi:hypothetical protein
VSATGSEARKAKIFTAKGWSEIDQLETRINRFLDEKEGTVLLHDVQRTDLAATTQGDGEPVIVVTVWYSRQ